MQHTRHELYGDEDFQFDDEPVNPTYAAYQCGLQGVPYQGYWVQGANLAYMRGRAARFGNPIIDFPNAPALTSSVILQA